MDVQLQQSADVRRILTMMQEVGTILLSLLSGSFNLSLTEPCRRCRCSRSGKQPVQSSPEIGHFTSEHEFKTWGSQAYE